MLSSLTVYRLNAKLHLMKLNIMSFYPHCLPPETNNYSGAVAKMDEQTLDWIVLMRDLSWQRSQMLQVPKTTFYRDNAF